jgi:hypothetical protein
MGLTFITAPTFHLSATCQLNQGETQLHQLGLNDTPLTIVGLEHLKALTGLTLLSWLNTQITDSGPENLKSLTRLESLYLSRAQVTDAGVQ